MAMGVFDGEPDFAEMRDPQTERRGAAAYQGPAALAVPVLHDNEKVTDAGMAFVGQMKGLEELVLNRNIGDAGIAHLAGLTDLKELHLSSTKISDSCLGRLTALCQLRRLRVNTTHVTAKGLLKLRGMKSLQQIDIGYTGIRHEDAESLRQSGIPAF